MLFIEESSPPPFYQPQLSDDERAQLDKWFIGHRSQAYYLKRFSEFDRQGYLSAKWHWSAFLVTFGWLLYRKRYLDAIVYSVAGWSFIQLTITIALVAFEFAFMSFVPSGHQMLVRLGIAGLIWVFWASMVARWADAYYYRMARREIADVVQDYQGQPERQKAKLAQEGGVSVIGLGLAFALFGFALMVIQVQFLPLYAKPKANALVQEAYQVTQHAVNRVENIYKQTGQCPTQLPLGTDTQVVTLAIGTTSPMLPQSFAHESACVVTATIHGVPFPNRNLNGQTLLFYRQSNSPQVHWRCQTSLNETLSPKGCN